MAHRTEEHPANPGCEEREAGGQQCRSAVLLAGCCRDRGARSSDHGVAEVRVITMATAWQCQETTYCNFLRCHGQPPRSDLAHTATAKLRYDRARQSTTATRSKMDLVA